MKKEPYIELVKRIKANARRVSVFEDSNDLASVLRSMAEKPKEISESPLCINYLNEIPDHIEGMFSTYQKLSEDILLLNETIDLMDLRNDL